MWSFHSRRYIISFFTCLIDHEGMIISFFTCLILFYWMYFNNTIVVISKKSSFSLLSCGGAWDKGVNGAGPGQPNTGPFFLLDSFRLSLLLSRSMLGSTVNFSLTTQHWPTLTFWSILMSWSRSTQPKNDKWSIYRAHN